MIYKALVRDSYNLPDGCRPEDVDRAAGGDEPPAEPVKIDCPRCLGTGRHRDAHALTAACYCCLGVGWIEVDPERECLTCGETRDAHGRCPDCDYDVCPYCKGDGMDPDPDSDEFYRDPPGSCRLCNGDGHVPTD